MRMELRSAEQTLKNCVGSTSAVKAIDVPDDPRGHNSCGLADVVRIPSMMFGERKSCNACLVRVSCTFTIPSFLLYPWILLLLPTCW